MSTDCSDINMNMIVSLSLVKRVCSQITVPSHCYLNSQKILEKLYNDRLERFLNKSDILSTSQYGFRYNMSTHALLELVEEISNALDNKKYATGVLIDLKKAFDTVDHHILANKCIYMV